MSSWQDYVDKHLIASRCVTKAAISGHDGTVWANSEGFNVTKEELSRLIAGFENQNVLAASGVTLAGSRFIYLSGTDKVIRAKLGKVGAHCVKTQQAVVVSLYEDPIQPQQAASVVEKLGDHLVAHGYWTWIAKNINNVASKKGRKNIQNSEYQEQLKTMYYGI